LQQDSPPVGADDEERSRAQSYPPEHAPAL
jgi:hypothetical protein